MEDPAFSEYFTILGPGYIGKRINKQLGLAKAIPFKYHSFTLHPEDEAQVKEMLQEAKPGNIVTLPNPPATVNIWLYTTKYFSKQQLQALKRYSIGPRGKIVIPIRESPSCEKIDVPIPGGLGYRSSRVTIRSRFPLEQGFR